MESPQPKGRAIDKALDYLSRRDHSVNELRDKLVRKGFLGEDIESAIERCRELRYLDDQNTATRLARHLALDKHLGQRAVIFRLIRRGFERSLAEQVVAAVCADPADDVVRAREAARRRFHKTPIGRENRTRAVRFLINRGYSWDTIRSALEL